MNRPALVFVLVAVGCTSGCGASKTTLGGGADGDAAIRADASRPIDGGTPFDATTDAPLPTPDAARDAAPPPNVAPIATLRIGRGAPGTITLDGSESRDPDGRIERYSWDFGDGGAMGEGAVVSHTFASAGCPTVRLTVTDDRGATGTESATVAIALVEPAEDVVAALDPLPLPGALLPRDLATNEATFTVSGTIESAGWEEVVVELLRDGAAETTLRAPVCDGAFSIDIAIPAELVARNVEVVLAAGDREAPLGATNDVVAGDVLLVQGQSNAVASMRVGDASENQGDFVRSFGSRVQNAAASAADGAWHRAEGNAAEGPGAVGQWPIRMAAALVAAHGIPIAIVNGARGGQPIEYFQRNDADPTDLATSYGRALDRARRSGAAGAIRAILFYQGESDAARAAEHRDGYTALATDWQEDYPRVERFYVTQVREGCAMVSVELRNEQRRFAETLPRTSVMSTNALDAHDGCHFGYEGGYRELGDRYARLLSRDLYGAGESVDVEAIDVTAARLDGDTIVVTTSSDATSVIVADGVAADFRLAGTTRTVTGVTAMGTDLVLALSAGPMPPTRVEYRGHIMAGPWITNAAGVGLLSFVLDVTP